MPAKSNFLTNKFLNVVALLLIIFSLPITVLADENSGEHLTFSKLLSKNVDNGEVDYSGFAENQDFQNYVDYIANKKFTEEASTEEKLAFYINAYNALAIKGILDGSSPSSFFGKVGYFKMDKYTIAGERMNLYDLEHEVIRPFGEPRIHFALVCASASCPKLRSEAYTASQLDEQLRLNAINFINDRTKNVFDIDKNKAKISKIFDWFEEDFTQNGSLQEYIAKYVEDPKVKSALTENAFKIAYKKYDWSLNGNL